MAIKKLFWCDECGATTDNEVDARAHENYNCMPWQEGDEVRVRLGDVIHDATVSHLGRPVSAGQKRLICVRLSIANAKALVTSSSIWKRDDSRVREA